VRRRVLIVDDEECVREVAQGYLTHLGYDTVTRRDGREGAEYYARHADEIDVVLIDMIMPRLARRECFRRLKKVNAGVQGDPLLRLRHERGGAEHRGRGLCGFVQKPYDMRAPRREIRRALTRHPLSPPPAERGPTGPAPAVAPPLAVERAGRLELGGP
jgi:CheY-like chemotaxis protein